MLYLWYLADANKSKFEIWNASKNQAMQYEISKILKYHKLNNKNRSIKIVNLPTLANLIESLTRKVLKKKKYDCWIKIANFCKWEMDKSKKEEKTHKSCKLLIIKRQQ